MKIYCIRSTSKDRKDIQYLTKQGDYTKSNFEDILFFSNRNEAEDKLNSLVVDKINFLDIFVGEDGYTIIVRQQKGWKRTKIILEEKLSNLNIPFTSGGSCNGYVMTVYHLNDLGQAEKDEMSKFSFDNDLDFDYFPGTVNYDSEGYFLNLNAAIFQG